jgi:hypothetical protein
VDPGAGSSLWVPDAAAVGLDAASHYHDRNDACVSSGTICWDHVLLYMEVVAALLPAVPPAAGPSFQGYLIVAGETEPRP